MNIPYKLMFVMAAVLLYSCQKKEEHETAQQLSGQPLTAFSHMAKYPEKVVQIDLKDVEAHAPDTVPPQQLKDIQDAHKLSGDPDPMPNGGGIAYVNPVRELVNWNAGSYSWLFEANEHVVYADYADQIYPGALIKGNSVQSFDFDPVVGYTPKPIRVSVSLPAPASKVAADIPVPAYTNTTKFINDILLNSQLSTGGFSRFNFNTKEFTYYDELKEYFASGVNTNAIFFNSSSTGTRDSKKIVKNTGLMAKFIQKNFTIDMDIPKAGQLIDLNVDPNILGAYSPVYVSSVTYGRLGIITVESNANFEQLNTAFKKAFGILGVVNGENTLTQEEMNIINLADIKVYLVGGSGVQAVQTVSGYQNFMNYVAGGQTFSPQAPGVPITFSMRYLSDHSACKAQFQINYGPISRTYARFEYANYTYPIKWGNTPEQPGVITGTNPDTYADVYLAFYQDANCSMPVKAYNFVKYNYEIKTTNTQLVPNPTSTGWNGISTSTQQTDIRNEQKGTSIYLGNWLIRSLDQHVTNQGVVKERDLIERQFTLLPGDGYFISKTVNR